ncbi:receptor-like serine/threonine-protein kinase At2g45590 isoform X2 [Gastrolobium bilobum]|uniref:receptor-like serine/threonine-protein kinase At2g45590 isoform X2 n=1 Tax=Gastrolobium bilobum TaxID=150636 RepID=UPI002AB1A886|nr:receptor-like serine/threonine-protein kinase At2g45590 isoform X2 [Gastrolobium bilobum]
MPSRPPLSPLSAAHRHHNHHHQIILAGVIAAALILLALIISLTIFLYRKLSYNRTAPFELNHRRFSYTELRRATNSFSPSTKLGHGGFGSVHKATLQSGESVALKVMDSPGSLQGEREFHNELSLCSNMRSPFILSLLGFSSDRTGRKLVLVYELMPNRSLQDALLDRRCPELMQWGKRFDVAVSVSKGLEYLHHQCDPPVIHGDIKPSNVLLDRDFKAKIGDFGLARVKTVVEDCGMGMVEEKKKDEEEMEVEDCGIEDRGSVLEEVESVVTNGTTAGLSPESCTVRVLDSDASPEIGVGAVTSPPEMVGVDKLSVVSDGCFDKLSIDSGNHRKKGGGGSGRDWWWKQESGGGSESGRVKDYVMEWIGSEIKKERPKSEWVESSSSPGSARNSGVGVKVKVKKNRKPREWWKEEFCEELSKKSKKKKRSLDCGGESWWQKDEIVREQKKKRKSKSSRGSIDWWLDGLSGEIRNGNGRRNSQDWVNGDRDIPKSGGISSTPSMRGTVCYIAPEYGGGGQLSEKCDVYSFGVLLLVLVAGRRPLQVTASPISEFERANLISWARQLAHNGRLLDLVDPSIHSLDKEQALLCITIALLCLQRSPGKRPSMKEIVGMLSGEAELPHLPFEFSPSPPSNFLFKSRKKAR